MLFLYSFLSLSFFLTFFRFVCYCSMWLCFSQGISQVFELLWTDVELLSPMTSWRNGCPHFLYPPPGFPRVLISGKSPYFQLLPSRPWKSPYFWIFSIEVREKSWFSIAVTKPRWSTSSCASWGFSKCCGNDVPVELFGNPSDPLTNHRWRMVWRHLVPAKIPRASFIKFYYVVTESQSADTWCHVVVVRNLIGPHSRRYTWRTLCKTSSIFVEIRQHT